VTWHLRTAALYLAIMARPFMTWLARYRRPARHHQVIGVLFEPVDVMIGRAALERLRRTHLFVDTAELDRRALNRLLEAA
jgi:hypothetical protein